jgi:hypothetical protein
VDLGDGQVAHLLLAGEGVDTDHDDGNSHGQDAQAVPGHKLARINPLLDGLIPERMMLGGVQHRHTTSRTDAHVSQIRIPVQVQRGDRLSDTATTDRVGSHDLLLDPNILDRRVPGRSLSTPG